MGKNMGKCSNEEIRSPCLVLDIINMETRTDANENMRKMQRILCLLVSLFNFLSDARALWRLGSVRFAHGTDKTVLQRIILSL